MDENKELKLFSFLLNSKILRNGDMCIKLGRTLYIQVWLAD